MRGWGLVFVVGLVAAGCGSSEHPQHLANTRSVVTAPLPPPLEPPTTIASTDAPNSQPLATASTPGQPVPPQPVVTVGVVAPPDQTIPRPEAAPVVQPPPSPETTTTTRPPCRDSHDAGCGEFFWEPPPAADRPLLGTVEFSPKHPMAGDEVAFTVTMHDGDAQPDWACSIQPSADFGDGAHEGTPMACDPPACDRYGAWTPPPPAPGQTTRVFRHAFANVGTFTVTFRARSTSSGTNAGCADRRSGRPGDPYASVTADAVSVSVQRRECMPPCSPPTTAGGSRSSSA